MRLSEHWAFLVRRAGRICGTACSSTRCLRCLKGFGLFHANTACLFHLLAFYCLPKFHWFTTWVRESSCTNYYCNPQPDGIILLWIQSKCSFQSIQVVSTPNLGFIQIMQVHSIVYSIKISHYFRYLHPSERALVITHLLLFMHVTQNIKHTESTKHQNVYSSLVAYWLRFGWKRFQAWRTRLMQTFQNDHELLN